MERQDYFLILASLGIIGFILLSSGAFQFLNIESRFEDPNNAQIKLLHNLTSDVRSLNGEVGRLRHAVGLPLKQAPTQSRSLIPAKPYSLAGWPVTTGSQYGRFIYPPSIADIDDNGRIDIVASGQDGIYAWDDKGNQLPGWPKIKNLSNYYFTPSLVDIDGDKTMEIFGGAESLNQIGLSHTGSTLPGWPNQTFTGSYFNYPTVIADIDNDGEIEIIAGTREISNAAEIYIWKEDGTIFPGWPQKMDYRYAQSIAVADLDHDSDLEIIAIDYDSRVFVWNHDGTLFGQWPITPQPNTQTFPPPIGGTYSNSLIKVAVGDINYDGNYDIVAMTFNFAQYEPNKRIWIHAFNINGIELPNFPVEISGLFAEFRPDLVLGDLNNDNLLEIIVTTTKKLLVVKSNGTYSDLPQVPFPAQFSAVKGAVIANIDNDPEKEVISPVWFDDTLGSPQDAWGEIYAWNHDGTVVNNFPIMLSSILPTTQLSITDVNKDGSPEISGGFEMYNGTSVDNGLYVYSLPGFVLGKIDWGTFAHDIQHTNWFK
jgi:hypothetical protein